MKYIVCEKPGKFLLKEKETPIRKENEALLKVNKGVLLYLRASLCNKMETVFIRTYASDIYK